MEITLKTALDNLELAIHNTKENVDEVMRLLNQLSYENKVDIRIYNERFNELRNRFLHGLKS